MDKLNIYLGDLTYNTVGVSTEALPINKNFGISGIRASNNLLF